MFKFRLGDIVIRRREFTTRPEAPEGPAKVEALRLGGHAQIRFLDGVKRQLIDMNNYELWRPPSNDT